MRSHSPGPSGASDSSMFTIFTILHFYYIAKSCWSRHWQTCLPWRRENRIDLRTLAWQKVLQGASRRSRSFGFTTGPTQSVRGLARARAPPTLCSSSLAKNIRLLACRPWLLLSPTTDRLIS